MTCCGILERWSACNQILNRSLLEEIKVSITMGIVGLPNVGKSSLINSLKRSHVVNVGATPGLTRSMQEIQLDKKVKLLDCLGVVMLKSGESDASIALHNCKRIEKLDVPVSPVKEILKLCPAERLISLYKLPSFSSVDDFLQMVATIRGKLKKGGIVDVEAVARVVLHDWNEGKIPYYTVPPTKEGVDLETKIVSEFDKEFDVDEIKLLQRKIDTLTKAMEVESKKMKRERATKTEIIAWCRKRDAADMCRQYKVFDPGSSSRSSSFEEEGNDEGLNWKTKLKEKRSQLGEGIGIAINQ